MKKVLIIAYYFPPAGGGGVQRTSKFVKYLPIYGWQPIVLTVNERVYKKTDRSIDATLLDDIPKDSYIIRTGTVDLANISRTIKKTDKAEASKLSCKSILRRIGALFINPDAQMLWIPIATLKGIFLIKKLGIDILYSTGNPWSDHIIGLMLKIITGLPWVADYRDPWNLNPFTKHPSKTRKKIHLFLESKVLTIADKVIFTTKRTKRDYEKMFPYNKYEVIQNAFDPDDFVHVRPEVFSNITILYSGNIQYFKSPRYFIDALSNFVNKNPPAKRDLTILFLGTIDEITTTVIEKKNLQDMIYLGGYVSHKESIAALLGADILLLMRDIDGESILPGKIFEYLASGKPILALIPPNGSAADVLRKEGRGEYIAHPRDVKSIENKLMLLYKKSKTGCLSRHAIDNLQAYTRSATTMQLASLFNAL